MKQRIFTILRFVIPLLLLGWIVHKVYSEIEDPDQVRDYLKPEKIPRLALAIVPYLAAVLITFWRWYILVRAIDLPFRFRDALRLGFIGYFLQFLSLGTVGGDVFKAVFLAKEQPRRRPEAVATVFIDRAVGMFGLLLITSGAFWWLGWNRLPASFHTLAITCFVATGTGCFVVACLLWTPVTTRPLRQLLRRFPSLCAALLRGEHGLQLYRTHRKSFVIAVAAALLSNSLVASSAYVTSHAIATHPPSFGEQMVAYNIAGALGTLPLSPGGLGTFEAAYTALYQVVSDGRGSLQDGFVVALVMRFISVAVAGIGIVVYWLSRREMRGLLEQAKLPEP